MAAATPQKKKPGPGYYILIAVLAGNILLMFGLIWLSEVNRPELVEQHYYTAGSIDSVKRETNANLASGWIPTVRYDNGILRVTIFDSLRHALSGLRVNAALYRPSSDLLDRPEVNASASDSTYDLTLQPPLQRGLWNILLTVTSQDGKRLHKRLPLIVEQ